MPEKILVIDDEKAVRESTVSLLRRKGYDAHSASSGEEALELIKNESYDLLILDVRMPGMDGIEVLHRATELIPDIQVVMLTGHGTMDTAIEAMEYGAIGFLRKPVTIHDLQISIVDALARGNTRKENSRLKSLMPIFDLNSRLLSELDEKNIVGLVMKAVGAEVDIDHIEITLWNENGDTMERYTSNTLSGYTDSALKRSEDMKKKVASTKQPLVYSTGDGNTCESWEHIHLIDSGYEIYIPFISRNTVIGVLKAIKAFPQKPLRPSNLDFLVMLCNQSSIAITNSRLYRDLGKAHLEVEELLRRIITNIEDERLRISLELHDGPMQSILAAVFSVQASRTLLGESMKEIDDILSSAAQALLESSNNIRRIISDLHPPDLAKSGLISAIQEYLSIINDEGKIKCHINVKGEARQLKYDSERVIYYIIREAVTNSKKHAQASSIEVRLEFLQDKLIIVARDDGIGFTYSDENENPFINNIGLRSIRERARFLHGEISITPKIGQGTLIQLVIPLDLHLQNM